MFCSSCLPLSPETLTQNIETILKLYNVVFLYYSYWTNCMFYNFIDYVRPGLCTLLKNEFLKYRTTWI